MTSLLRFGAISGIFAGLFIALASVFEIFAGETTATSAALGLSPALGLPLVVGLHLGQLRASGRLGIVGFAVNLVGLGLFGGAGYTLNLVLFPIEEVIEVDDLAGISRIALLVSALVFSVGVVLFGLSMVRARVYPRIPAVAYVLAFPLIALLAPLPDSPLISATHIVTGIALVWLSAALHETARTKTPDHVAA
ncbi:hypothetical protein [Phytoactinopolyspora halotolerans]|uniref:DUF998 domain-containing protein n=1 Tax=Phytoactinopolyspora halotolerans TaxID=1981512 RepID=A0A6L9SCM0_9ACTN|nr:hypothetical protein [Phytoactinopolyspora halotolerans]NEE02976.1 hypothetical protein [Phytoactinopolyspora halotolerans]